MFKTTYIVDTAIPQLHTTTLVYFFEKKKTEKRQQTRVHYTIHGSVGFFSFDRAPTVS